MGMSLRMLSCGTQQFTVPALGQFQAGATYSASPAGGMTANGHYKAPTFVRPSPARILGGYADYTTPAGLAALNGQQLIPVTITAAPASQGLSLSFDPGTMAPFPVAAAFPTTTSSSPDYATLPLPAGIDLYSPGGNYQDAFATMGDRAFAVYVLSGSRTISSNVFYRSPTQVLTSVLGVGLPAPGVDEHQEDPSIAVSYQQTVDPIVFASWVAGQDHGATSKQWLVRGKVVTNNGIQRLQWESNPRLIARQAGGITTTQTRLRVLPSGRIVIARHAWHGGNSYASGGGSPPILQVIANYDSLPTAAPTSLAPNAAFEAPGVTKYLIPKTATGGWMRLSVLPLTTAAPQLGNPPDPVCLAWAPQPNMHNEIWYSCGTTASMPTPAAPILSFAGSMDTSPVIALAPGGHAAGIAWIEGGVPKYTLIEATNGVWPTSVNPSAIIALPQIPASMPAVAIVCASNIYSQNMPWASSPTNACHKISGTDKYSGIDLRFDGEGRLWMSYYDQYKTQVVATSCDDGRTWSSAVILNPLGRAGDDTMAVLAVDGWRPMLGSYPDIGGGRRSMALRGLSP
jgi:hypothetical protein